LISLVLLYLLACFETPSDLIGSGSKPGIYADKNTVLENMR
jgi:hypothetical protein